MMNEIWLLDEAAQKIKEGVDPQEILEDIEFIRDEKRSEEFLAFMENVAKEHREILVCYKLIYLNCKRLVSYMELVDEAKMAAAVKNRINRYKRNRIINASSMQEVAEMLLEYSQRNIKICARFILTHNEKDDTYYNDIEKMKTRFEVIESLTRKFMADVLLLPEYHVGS